MPSLEEIRSRFQNDHFAMDATGIVIDYAEPGQAVCYLTLAERHKIMFPWAAPCLRWRILPAP